MMTSHQVRFVIFVASMAAGMTLALQAKADPLVFSYTLPVTNTDGSAIPASGPGSLVSVRTDYGSCTGTPTAPVFGVKAGEVVVPVPAAGGQTPDLAPGTYCIRSFAKNTYNAESVASVVARKVIAVPVPNPPTGVTIQANLIELRKGVNGYWVARSIGYAPKGTSCYGEALLRNYKVVEGNITYTVNQATITGKIAGVCT